MIYLIGKKDCEDYKKAKELLGQLGIVPREVPVEGIGWHVEVMTVSSLYTGLREIEKAISNAAIHEGMS